ncbi:MAG: FAD-binding oxidoreductase [Amaricoccus sp.]
MRLDLLTANDRPGAYPSSWYAAVADPLAPFPPLAGDIAADVCVVGGGYTGLSAALHLAEQGFDVALLEASRVGWGASGRNGGQVGTGQRRDQDWLERTFGHDRAHALWDMAEEAKALVRGLVARHRIACDLRPGIIHAAHRPGFVAEYHAEAEHLARAYGYDMIESLDRFGLRAILGSDGYFGGALDRGGAHLNPLDYALGLARAAAAAGVRIFEGSRVERVGPPVATASGRVRARFVLLACNGYLGGLAPAVSARVMPINNFIVATEPLGEARARALIANGAAVADSRFVVNYFRTSADHRLLFGGGESYGWRFPSDIAGLVRPRMLAVFPELPDVAIDYAWGGTLAITVNRMPAFQRLAPDVLSASGYSGHGVAMATLAGKLMAEAVQGTAGRFDVFATLPQPPFPGGAALRWPLLVLAMSWYALRDRL